MKNQEMKTKKQNAITKEEFLSALHKSTRIVKKGKSERGKKKTSA